MAMYGSKDISSFLIDGVDLTKYLTKITDGGDEAVIEDTTVFGDTWQEQQPTGNLKSSIAIEGFYDDTLLSGSDAALVSKIANVRVLSYLVGPNFRGFSGAVESKYARTAVMDKFTRFTADFATSGPVEHGVSVKSGTVVAAGDSTAASIDNGALSSAGGAGYLSVSALTLGGFTNLAAKVRHSVDNAVWVDLIAFTAVTAAPAAERKTVAGTVNRYISGAWAFTGAGAGESATLSIGFVRN